jgi:CpeT protein
MKNILFLIICTNLFIGCSVFESSNDEDDIKQKDTKAMTELLSSMQGVYTSEKQSKLDKSFYNITLRMTPIWKNKGHYLAVEQALSDKLDKPYRIRVYQIIQISTTEFVTNIYMVKREKKWIGKWKTPKGFDSFNDKDLIIKEGCDILLVRTAPNKFIGKTAEKTCSSELKGATYATTKMNVYQNKIVSWDQGFNAKGKQVWGATKGGYVFDKLNAGTIQKVSPIETEKKTEVTQKATVSPVKKENLKKTEVAQKAPPTTTKKKTEVVQKAPVTTAKKKVEVVQK